MTVDYVTRQVMQISLSLKLYDPASGQPQRHTLNTRVEVPNLLQPRGVVR